MIIDVLEEALQADFIPAVGRQGVGAAPVVRHIPGDEHGIQVGDIQPIPVVNFLLRLHGVQAAALRTGNLPHVVPEHGEAVLAIIQHPSAAEIAGLLLFKALVGIQALQPQHRRAQGAALAVHQHRPQGEILRQLVKKHADDAAVHPFLAGSRAGEQHRLLVAVQYLHPQGAGIAGGHLDASLACFKHPDIPDGVMLFIFVLQAVLDGVILRRGVRLADHQRLGRQGVLADAPNAGGNMDRLQINAIHKRPFPDDLQPLRQHDLGDGRIPQETFFFDLRKAGGQGQCVRYGGAAEQGQYQNNQQENGLFHGRPSFMNAQSKLCHF